MRTLQMLHSLGMSESILLLIERRGRADLLIFVCLAIFTLLFIYALIYYIKPMIFG